MVSCLITYATQKMGEKDPQVVALHGLITGAGLRGMLDQAFGVEDVGGRVMARLDGISHRVTYAGGNAKKYWRLHRSDYRSDQAITRRRGRNDCCLALSAKAPAGSATMQTPQRCV